MCGIVGYIGHREAYPIILEGLKRLEYRGYDSAGIMMFDGEEIHLSKTKGKVSDLEEITEKETARKNGNIGIGHTRWATHGVPNDVNSHPHFSQTGDLVIVHNGIIENYESLKPYINRIREGEQNVLWNTEIKWFAQSSGTTAGKSKFIPVSKESLELCHYKGGKDLMSIYLNHFPNTDVLDGKKVGTINAVAAYDVVTKFKVIVNLESAEKMSVTIPQDVLSEATEIIKAK